MIASAVADRYMQRPVAVSQVSSAAHAALEVQPQAGAVVPLRGKHRRLAPQAVDEPHSQRCVEGLQTLPGEQLVEVQGTGPQLPVGWQR